MKKIIIFTFIILFSSIIQNYSQIKSGLGFKAGISVPNYRIPATTSFKIEPSNVIGFRGGVFLDIGISKMFDIQAELDFITKPANITLNTYSGGSTDSGSFITRYFTYSIKPKIKLTQSKVVPYFSAGPILNIYASYDVYGINYPNTISIQEKDNFTTLNYGITVSAGCEFNKILPFTLITELSFSPDLDVMFRDGQTKLSGKTYGIDFVVGCKF